MIIVRNLRKSFGARVLLRDAELRVGARDRLALVGPNGSGKTTLVEIIVGRQSADGGVVDIAGGVTLGYLAQETDELRGRSVLEEVCRARSELASAEHRLAVLHHELEECDDPAESDALLAEFARMQDRFETLGGYTVESDARRILGGLGFSDRDVERRTETLSGGWLMRVALAKLLLAAPDCLLLDEPTNHLDLESVVWLEKFLRGYEGAVLVISHDRDFLNGIATKVVEIEDAQLVSYTGDYASFVEQRRQRLEQQQAAARNQARQIEHVQSFIDRFRYKASKARAVQSRIKMLDKIERIDAPSTRRKAMKSAFPQPPRSGRVVLELSDVDFSYPDAPVYTGLNAEIERGQKVVLVGPNGAGKTTFLKLAAGVLAPDAGERRVGHNVEVGYFAQHTIEALDPKNRVIEEMQHSIPPGSPLRARDLLGRFLFSGDDVDKPVSVLSGGERTRLALAKLLVSPCNFLCLDEPTNHLDVESRDALEDALVEYQGALLLITHDRHLIRSVANRVFEVQAGALRAFEGDYELYLWRREQDAQPQARARATHTAPVPSPNGRRESAKDRRRASADERARLKAQRDALTRVERELEKLQARKAQIESFLADPDAYAKADGVTEKIREYEKCRVRTSELEAEWVRLAELLESTRG